ncbi:MAG: hypothetical protein ACLSFJ_02665 [Holdemania filiformis]
MTSQKIILIVEDNEINRAMLRGILESEYKVLEAPNGLEALKVLNDQKDNVSDLIDIIDAGRLYVLSILKTIRQFLDSGHFATQNDNEPMKWPRFLMERRISLPNRIGRRSSCIASPVSSACAKALR